MFRPVYFPMAADGPPARVRTGFGQALDPAVLNRARRGDRAAFKAIYLLYGRSCYNLALRVLGESAAAEDIVHDVFLRMMDALPGFRGEAPFGAWLKRMTANATIDAVRRDRRFSGIDDPAWLDDTAADATPADVAVDAWSLLMSLSPRSRAVVLLHELEGYTHKELSQLFGQSESYSKSLLARALRRLGRFGQGGDEDGERENVNDG